MPLIDDPSPPAVQSDMDALRTYLGETVPSKRLDENLLIATWNIRGFGSLTREWTATEHHSPKRDLRGLLAIGEIIRRFDVVAVQEVKGDLRALRDLLKWLGPDWAFLMTDVTAGAPGNGERMAFLFDRRRLELSGLACELVVPQPRLGRTGPMRPIAGTSTMARRYSRLSTTWSTCIIATRPSSMSSPSVRATSLMPEQAASTSPTRAAKPAFLSSNTPDRPEQHSRWKSPSFWAPPCRSSRPPWQAYRAAP